MYYVYIYVYKYTRINDCLKSCMQYTTRAHINYIRAQGMFKWKEGSFREKYVFDAICLDF